MSRPRELMRYAKAVAVELCAALDGLGALEGPPFERAVSDAMHVALQQLARTGIWGRDNQWPSAEFWHTAAHWLELGPLQLQARAKPYGYAGDFDLLYRICDNVVASGRVPRAFDLFFQSQAAPHAVRNRAALMAEQVMRRVRDTSAGRVRVASVGSGPAWELQRCLLGLEAEERRRLQLHLLDLDPRALDFSQQLLQPWLNADQLRLHRVNLKRLPCRPADAQVLAGADLIYCLGFFDYLSDEEAATMLQALWARLAPGGELWVFQFSAQNPSRAYMEWCGNWYLQYRLEADLQRIAGSAGLTPPQLRFGTEAAGVNLYLQARRPT